MPTITGTEGNDSLSDTGDDDTINALGGNDWILTRGGFNIVNAGAGDDDAEVGDGQLDMGDGNDLAFVFSTRNNVINLGAGNDWAQLRPATGVIDTVTLGSGRDHVVTSFQSGGTQLFTDFDVGPGGDVLEFSTWYWRNATWWFTSLGPSGITNPFGVGRAQLIDSATGALLQVRSTLDAAWTTIATFQGRTASQFHADNFKGWSPTGAPALATVLNIAESNAFLRSTSNLFRATQDTYGDDIIYGTAAGGYIGLTNGNDVVYAGGGNDIILSGGISSGLKIVYGGDGDDEIGFNGLIYANDVNGWPVEAIWAIIYGGNGNDQLGGTWMDDEIHGDAGNDRIGGGGGRDRLYGGDGDDRIDGGLYDDILSGGAGNDHLLGGTENDQLSGDAGADLIEGGRGDDLISGGSEADQLTGNDGADTFRDTAANLNSDTITDFSVSDRIVISNASLNGFAFSLAGNVLSFTGGSLTLTTLPTGPLIASAAQGGGVQLAQFGAVSPDNDFNGDGRSDLILQNGSGAFSVWRGQASGALVEVAGLAANALDASWKVAGLGDFNGDGRDDILWRHSSGTIGQWQGQSGQFTNNSGVAANAVDNSWVVAGIADYNGDGRDDILWRHASGEIGQWLGQPNGSFANNGGAAANVVDNSWSVVASGDFNGDGRADILWRHSSGAFAEWQGSASGRLNNNGAVMASATGSVVGSGDFNGDGRDDILIRNPATGALMTWQGRADGQFTQFVPGAQVGDLNWKIVAIGDYNGDGRDDLIWRHSSGAGVEWLATANGDFVNNGAVPTAAAGWSVQSPDIFLI